MRALPHYAAPALAAGWLAAALAAFHLRSLARGSTPAGTGTRTAAHLCAPPLLWLAAMHAGAWLEWRVRRTPIAYGTDWFYAEMYQEYVREPGGLVLTASIAVAVAAPLAAVLVSWLACACVRPRRTAEAVRPEASSETEAPGGQGSGRETGRPSAGGPPGWEDCGSGQS